MDTSLNVLLPASPEELIAAVSSPQDRVVMVSQVGKRRNYLSRPWAELRLSDWRKLLDSGCTQSRLVDLTGLSRARVSVLSGKALERVSA